MFPHGEKNESARLNSHTIWKRNGAQLVCMGGKERRESSTREDAMVRDRDR